MALALDAFLPVVDWSEALWFTATTVLIVSSVMFGVCSILELVERKGLFEHARIQTKVRWRPVCCRSACETR